MFFAYFFLAGTKIISGYNFVAPLKFVAKVIKFEIFPF